MCGIFGYAGPATDAAGLVFDGLKELEYRGYDSWGIAVDNGRQVVTAKDVGKLVRAPDNLGPAELAVGHTRWATTGAVTECNAHPHTDCTGQVAVVHNGIVENYVELKADLLARGHHFASQTDSEVIAHLVEEALAANPDRTLAEAVRQVSLLLEGMNAIVAMDVARGELAAYKNGSPLVVGLDEGANYVASDIAALLKHTRHIIWLRDGQVASISKDKVSLMEAATGEPVPLVVERVAWDPQQAELGAYPHYLEKEILGAAGAATADRGRGAGAGARVGRLPLGRLRRLLHRLRHGLSCRADGNVRARPGGWPPGPRRLRARALDVRAAAARAPGGRRAVAERRDD